MNFIRPLARTTSVVYASLFFFFFDFVRMLYNVYTCTCTTVNRVCPRIIPAARRISYASLYSTSVGSPPKRAERKGEETKGTF